VHFRLQENRRDRSESQAEKISTRDGAGRDEAENGRDEAGKRRDEEKTEMKQENAEMKQNRKRSSCSENGCVCLSDRTASDHTLTNKLTPRQHTK
jgi:hypothetical protein